MRLSTATLGELNPSVERFAYDRDAQAIGIVHLGIGAFHRVHQAWYTDRAMDAGDRDWAIAGVSLRSDSVAAELNPQNGLYTVAERSWDHATYRLVGSVREVSVAKSDPQRAVARLGNPSTQIVTFTVTEKGYCRGPDGNLDFAQAEANAIYPLIARGLARRRRAGLTGSGERTALGGRSPVPMVRHHGALPQSSPRLEKLC